MRKPDRVIWGQHQQKQGRLRPAANVPRHRPQPRPALLRYRIWRMQRIQTVLTALEAFDLGAWRIMDRSSPALI